MKFSFLDWLFVLGSFFGHVILVSILVIRKNLKGFRVFKAYLALIPVQNLVLALVSVYASRRSYTYSYWIGTYAEYPVLLAVIYQIAKGVLEPLGSLMRESAKKLWALAVLCLTALAALAVGFGPASVHTSSLAIWENRLGIFVSLVSCGVIVALSLTANSYLLQVRTNTFAIAQGIFIWSYSVLVVDLLHAFLGLDRWSLGISLVFRTVYIGVLVYWMVVFWKPETVKPPLPDDIMARLFDLHETVKYDLVELGDR